MADVCTTAGHVHCTGWRALVTAQPFLASGFHVRLPCQPLLQHTWLGATRNTSLARALMTSWVFLLSLTCTRGQTNRLSETCSSSFIHSFMLHLQQLTQKTADSVTYGSLKYRKTLAAFGRPHNCSCCPAQLYSCRYPLQVRNDSAA